MGPQVSSLHGNTNQNNLNTSNSEVNPQQIEMKKIEKKPAVLNKKLQKAINSYNPKDKNKIELIRTLLYSGADPNGCYSYGNWNPLQTILTNALSSYKAQIGRKEPNPNIDGYLKLVDMLIEYGADLNWDGNDKRFGCSYVVVTCFEAALELSLETKNCEIIKPFMNKGVNLNELKRRDAHLNMSATYHYLKLIIEAHSIQHLKLFLEYGIDPNLMLSERLFTKSKNEMAISLSPLLLVSRLTCDFDTKREMFFLLLAYGSNINTYNVWPKNPTNTRDFYAIKATLYHDAILRNDIDMIKLCVKCGCSPDLPYIEKEYDKPKEYKTSTFALCKGDRSLLDAFILPDFHHSNFHSYPKSKREMVRVVLLCFQRFGIQLPAEIRNIIFTYALQYSEVLKPFTPKTPITIHNYKKSNYNYHNNNKTYNHTNTSNYNTNNYDNINNNQIIQNTQNNSNNKGIDNSSDTNKIIFQEPDTNKTVVLLFPD